MKKIIFGLCCMSLIVIGGCKSSWQREADYQGLMKCQSKNFKSEVLCTKEDIHRYGGKCVEWEYTIQCYTPGDYFTGTIK